MVASNVMPSGTATRSIMPLKGIRPAIPSTLPFMGATADRIAATIAESSWLAGCRTDQEALAVGSLRMSGCIVTFLPHDVSRRMKSVLDTTASSLAEHELLQGSEEVEVVEVAHRHSGHTIWHCRRSLYPKRATYERTTAASIFESTPSCAKITVPEG